MLASAIVSIVQKNNPDWPAATILNILNDVLNMVLKRESDQNVYLDPTTGDMPFLATTDGTFTYNITIPNVTIWKVGGIVIDYTNFLPNVGSPTMVWSGQMYAGLDISGAVMQNFDALFTDVFFGAKKYRKAPCKLTDALGNQPCTATFLGFSPSTSTNLYRILAYTANAPIALNSYVPIPDKFEYTLVACISEIIDALDNGRFADIWNQLQTTWLPQLTYQVDKDMQLIYSTNYTW
jgi:hypothetical protein